MFIYRIKEESTYHHYQYTYRKCNRSIVSYSVASLKRVLDKKYNKTRNSYQRYCTFVLNAYITFKKDQEIFIKLIYWGKILEPQFFTQQTMDSYNWKTPRNICRPNKYFIYTQLCEEYVHVRDGNT